MVIVPTRLGGHPTGAEHACSAVAIGDPDLCVRGTFEDASARPAG